ncbi:DNA mismatch repair endonuclease MutL [Alkalicoccus halolimnae]|uniref:DNA mismatch repair protein MutL n=1 Tax=Alkalicoccus halolimnae TaxID=1667239 RepID=A0A5C7FCU9_9BACI|nr:DNA mismatch repair endonuclease MutL [Alkalicoccus halolimnae]TXF87310.1 DNA mismatch repair endonuclease MutL [Alkalicoccus halolimnae]
MGRIIKLNEQLSNKIAAGEVVERPASVVKELVENAVDAGSSRIRVDVFEGGLSSIRVMDDGEGILEEDREAAFFRHATSKIKTDRDLFRIGTLGFRGEALPSIASVAEVTLTTSGDGRTGEKIIVKGGQVKTRTSAPPRKGTEIIVEDLFFNTPARLKYLKTIHTELGHISDILNRMALARPDIAFELYNEGRTMLKTSGRNDLLQVLYSIYGKTAAGEMKVLKASSADFQIKGYAASPSEVRSSRSYMTMILNGRYIKNHALVKAVLSGYNTLLPIGKFPIVCLHISLNPQLVDVNVHPSKMEVRLSKEKALQELVTETVRNVWRNEQLIPSMQEPKSKTKIPKPEQVPFSFPAASEQGVQTFKAYNAEEKQGNQEEDFLSEGNLSSAVSEKETAGAPQEIKEDNPSFHEAPSNNEKKEEQDLPYLYPIGQLHGTYILAQNETGFYMIDQHAAQERINYEYFAEKLSSPAKELKELLIPLTLDVTSAEAVLLEEYRSELEKVGLFIEAFGKNSFLIRAYPSWFPADEEKETILEMVEQIKESQKVDIAALRDDAAALMACKGAIKANHHLRHEDMEALIKEWRKCREPYTCPHGRPVMIHYTIYELEKMFKRVMN